MATITDLLQGTPGQSTAVPGVTQQPAQQSVGVKAITPQNNIQTPPKTLPTTQIAPRDLSSTYANVGGRIYNTQSQTMFSNPADFFKDSGVSSFDNLKFNTNYTPTGRETIYGQSAPQVTLQPQVTSTAQTPQITPNPAPSAPPASNTGAYTPPNQGTTGVSQGGIIGNLINNANTASNGASAAYLKDKAALQALEASNAQANANIESEPIDLSLATGEKGILQRLFAARQGALQTGIQNDLGLLNAGTSANSSAGQLNAPIVNPQTQGLVNPSANTTTGATTSGAVNLNSLIGTRTDANGKANGEYFNKSTGQAFANPQALADYVNQQSPGIGATAQNVFQLLQSQGQSGQGGNLNQILSGLGITGNSVGYFTGLIQAVQNSNGDMNAAHVPTAIQPIMNQILQQMSGGQYSPGNASINYGLQGTQAAQQAAYQSASQQANALSGQLQTLITSSKINPSNLTAVNGIIQGVSNFASDPNYQQFSNLLTDIASRYAQVLTPTGGNVTDYKAQTAQGLLSGLASGQSISQVLGTLDQQAKAVITNVPTTGLNTGLNSGIPNQSIQSNNTVSSSGSIPAGSLAI